MSGSKQVIRATIKDDNEKNQLLGVCQSTEIQPKKCSREISATVDLPEPATIRAPALCAANLKGCHIAKSVNSPDFPSIRASEGAAFLTTGVDFVDPLNIHEKQSSNMNFCMCLFTCVSTRAVHLELAPDLSAATFKNVSTILQSPWASIIID